MAVTRFCVRSYEQDSRIFPSLAAKIGLSLLAALLFALPWIAGKYIIFVTTVAAVSIIGALGLNVLTGFTGLISLGHAAFLGVGAYTAAILSTRYHLPFLVTIPLAGITAAMFGAVVGIPTLRLKGMYLLVTTLAFQFIVEHIIYHWEDFTAGDRGISLPDPDLFGITLDKYSGYYYVVIVIAVITAILVKNLSMSRAGRALVAVRDRDIAAEMIGVNVARYKIIAFIISSFIAGIAGALYAYLLGLISPDHFTLGQSILYVAMIIVGGLGTVMGSIIGAIFMVLLPELISLISSPISSAYPLFAPRMGGISVMIYGFILVLFLLFEPKGIVGIWIRIKRYWLSWPYTY